MKAILSLLGAAFLLMILFGVFGLFAAIFNGILWMIANHWITLLCIGASLWLVVSFILRLVLAYITDER